MTPAARVQGAIDLLDAILAAVTSGGAPADRVASDWFRARRYAGGGDRRAIRELAWRAIRACGEIPESGRAAMLCVARSDPSLAALFNGSAHGPAPIGEGEALAEPGIAPAWLIEALAASGVAPDEQSALLERAPLDIRANRLKTSRDGLREAVGGEIIAAPEALRFPAGAPAETWPEFAQGLFEVQDSGSQIACAALDVRPGEAAIDLCAGAGGKTLALAAALGNRGSLLACDTDRGRLRKLPPRAERAGAIVETRLLDPGRELEALTRGRTDVGAVASFIGVVRDANDGSDVASLTLEHYPGMTEKALGEICAQALARWDILETLVIHRIGALVPGDRIVLVGVSSAHRGEAFEACEFIMDYLKTRAPFWKKEATPQGERWVEARESDDAAAQRWKG